MCVFFVCFRSNDCDICQDIIKLMNGLPPAKQVLVVDHSKFSNRSVHELRLLLMRENLLKLREEIEQIHEKQKSLVDTSQTVNCITWEVQPPNQPVALNIDIFQQKFVYQQTSGENTENRLAHLGHVFDTQFSILQDRSNEFSENYKKTIIFNSITSRLKMRLSKNTISVLDIWCINSAWQQQLLASRSDVKYTCSNPLTAATKSNQQQQAASSQNSSGHSVSFITKDFVASKITGSFDLILAVDFLQHLWFEDVRTLINHVNLSKSKYFLVTDMYAVDDKPANVSGRAGMFSLEREPFNLVPPTCSNSFRETASLALWKIPLYQKHFDKI